MTKILFIVLFSGITFLGLSSFGAIHFVTKANKKILYQESARSLAYSGNKIASTLHSIEHIGNLMISNDSIQEYLYSLQRSSDPADRTIAYKNLYNTLISYSFELRPFCVSYVSIVNPVFTISSDTSFDKILPDTVKANILEKAEKASGAAAWVLEPAEEYGIFSSRIVRRIENLEFDNLGTVVFKLDMERLIQEAISSPYYEEKPSFIFFSDNKIFYKSNDFIQNNTAEILTKTDSIRKTEGKNFGVIKINNKNYFSVRNSIPDFEWEYIYLIPYDETHDALLYIKLVFFFIIWAGIMLVVLFSTVFIHSLTKHINYLLEKIRSFRGESQQIPASSKSNYNYAERKDEIGVLHQQFDRMVSEINSLIQMNYKTDLLMKEAQLVALENQINPHFLYNTLESVNWRAKMIGAQEISTMVESLGNLLRITLNNSTDHCLETEIKLVNFYLAIQKLRFEERLEVVIKSPLEHGSYKIPKLTIQPLVENAIHHSLEISPEDCKILIISEEEKDNLIIKVCNSGSQFEDGLMEKLAEGTIKKHRTGIGLLNISKRIKLTFGGQYGLSLYNSDSMAIAKITIPKVRLC